MFVSDYWQILMFLSNFDLNTVHNLCQSIDDVIN